MRAKSHDREIERKKFALVLASSAAGLSVFGLIAFATTKLTDAAMFFNLAGAGLFAHDIALLILPMAGLLCSIFVFIAAKKRKD